MRKFSELLGPEPHEAYLLASQWCDSKISQLQQEAWLEWASARIDRRNLLDLEVARTLFNYSMDYKRDAIFYARFVAYISLLCAAFYSINGGEITDEIAATMEKEANEIALHFPEQPKQESKKFELEERGEVTFIKGTNFVLSKFL